MTVKCWTAGIASVAIAIVAAAGAATAGSSPSTGAPAFHQVQFAALDAPFPLDQGANVPTSSQLTSVLNSLADPGVPFANKSGLVEGGISAGQALVADHEMKKAVRNGELPLTFSVANIEPSGPNAASAAVVVSGPKLPSPVTENLTFVNQGSWVLSHDSAMALVEAISD